MTALMSSRARSGVIAVLALAVFIGGCTATRARSGAPAQAGFLGDYSGLQNNPDYPAALVYIKPNTQWGKYSAIQLESAGVYASDKTSSLSAEDQERLAGMLYNTMSQELGKYFTVATSP